MNIDSDDFLVDEADDIYPEETYQKARSSDDEEHEEGNHDEEEFIAINDKVGTNYGDNVFDIDFEDHKFQIGSKFTDVDEFRLCVRQYNIVKNNM